MSSAVAPYRDCCYCYSPAFPKADLKPITFKTSEEWKQVIVLKKNEKGELIKDSAGNPIEHRYTLHVPTGDLYWDEEPASIATKCSLISFGSIFYTLATMFYHIGKVVTDIVKISIQTLKEVGRQYSEKGLKEASKALLKGFCWHLPGTTLYNLWNIVRDPFYGIAVGFSAVVGIFSPLQGRRMISICEFSWHHETSYKKDPRYDTDCEDISCKDFVKTINKAEVFYLGFCMQTRGNIKENRNLVVKVR